MTPKRPLQVAILADKSCEVTAGYLEVLEEAFRNDVVDHTPEAPSVAIPYRRVPLELGVDAMDADNMTDWLNGAERTLVILLVSNQLTKEPSRRDVLFRFLNLAAKVDTRNLVFALEQGAIDEILVGLLLGIVAPLADAKQHDVLEMGEYAFRRVAVALIAMSVVVRELARFSGNINETVKLFISHAKQDGQPLASALRNVIRALPDVECFYDNDEITLEESQDPARLDQILRGGVANSVMIVLRSEVYHQRPWCRAEMAMAEDYQAPYVVVELRHTKQVPAGTLDFGRGPTVWVADGNLYRILFCALRQAIMTRLHIVQAERLRDALGLDRDAFHILIRPPSLRGLAGLRDRLNRDRATHIVYPDPRMEAEEELAVSDFLSRTGRTITLSTLQTLNITGGKNADE